MLPCFVLYIINSNQNLCLFSKIDFVLFTDVHLILKLFIHFTDKSVKNRPISITPILSKIFERLLVKRLFSFVNRLNVLPPTQFGFRKALNQDLFL